MNFLVKMLLKWDRSPTNFCWMYLKDNTFVRKYVSLCLDLELRKPGSDPYSGHRRVCKQG